MMGVLPTVIKAAAFGGLALLAIASEWLAARAESDGHGRGDRDCEALDLASGKPHTDGDAVLEEATDVEVREAINRTEAAHE